MSKPKPTTTPAAAQAPPNAIPSWPLSPKEAKLYHELLEIVLVSLSGGGLGALRYLKAYARARSGNLSSGWAIRMKTLDKILIGMEEVRSKLGPHNQKQPAKAA
jgi:hypothetical protein